MKNMITGYDLSDNVEYIEVCGKEQVYREAQTIMQEMLDIMMKKTEHYSNLTMKGNFLSLYWELHRRWIRIYVSFKEPFVHKLDVILGRDPNTYYDITHKADRDIIMNERFKELIKSVRETFIDMANYSILAIILFEKSFDKAAEKVAELDKENFQEVK